MGAAVPAQQRSRNKPELVYPRPGIPTVHGARAAAALEGGDRHSVAEAFVGLVTRPWGREKPDASGATTDDRLYADLRQNFLSRYDSVPQAVVVWMAARMATAEPPAVRRYLLRVKLRLLAETGVDAMRHPGVLLFLKRSSVMGGTLRATARPSIAVDEYMFFLKDTSVSVSLRAAAAVAWRRIGRIADVAELRFGDLWEDESGVWIAQFFHKSAALGAHDRLAVVLDHSERLLLAGKILSGPPESHPLARPLLFPGLTAAAMASAVHSSLGRKVGAHTIRRSALRSALESGVSLPHAVLLSLHKDEATALSYALFPDEKTAAAMRMASRATTERSTAATARRTGY
jgi:hypothetical protein